MGYRERARISVKHVIKKGKTLVGFHEKRSSYVADMQSCEILVPKIARLLPLLAELVSGLSIRDRLPQIEVAVGEHVDALVLRVMDPPSLDDEAALRAFADKHEVQFCCNPKAGNHRPVPSAGCAGAVLQLAGIWYHHAVRASEFTQVNSALNRVMISRAIRLLNPQPGERIADLFCGLGNFTLPSPQRRASARHRGSEALVKRARQNAAANGLSGNTEFMAMNLLR